MEGSSGDLIGHALRSPVLQITDLTPKHTTYKHMHFIDSVVSVDARYKTPLFYIHEKIE